MAGSRQIRSRQGAVEAVCFVSVDLAGSTAFAAQAEPKQVELVLKALYETIVSLCRKHHGKIWSWEGDGGLLAFAGAGRGRPSRIWDNSVQCAIALDGAFTERIKGILQPDPQDPLRLRLAVHAAHLHSSHQLHEYNPDIAFAVHLQKYATRPGTVAISADVHARLTPALRSPFKEGFRFREHDIRTNSPRTYRFQRPEDGRLVRAAERRELIFYCADRSDRIRTLRYTAEDFAWLIEPFYRAVHRDRKRTFEMLTRNWVDEKREETAWNRKYRDLIKGELKPWSKHQVMKETAAKLAHCAGANAPDLKIEQRFYRGSPLLQIVLFDDEAVLLSDYGIVEPPRGRGGSRYKGVSQDALFFTSASSEGRRVIEWCSSVFNNIWGTAIPLPEMKRTDEAAQGERVHA